MQATWIVVANGSRARIFERHGRQRPLHEIQDFLNDGGRVDNEELRSDGRGRFHGGGERSQGDTWDPPSTPKQHESEVFSRTIADYLEQGRNEQRYEQLYLIAAPRFLGSLRQNMNKQVEKLVTAELPKDISTSRADEIAQFVQEQIEVKPAGL